MKRCPLCQVLNQDTAKFCTECGAAFGAAPAGPSPRMAAPVPPAPMPSAPAVVPTIPTRRSPAWLWAMGALVLLVGAAFAFDKAGIISFRGRPADAGVTRMQGEADSGILKAQAAPESGVTKIETPPPPVDSPMPNDVREYLEHVRQTEERRHAVCNRQLAAASVLMVQLQGLGGLDVGAILGDDTEMKPPTEDLAAETAKMRSEWKELSQFFLSKRAPSECVALQSHYDTAIGETSSQILDLMDILGSQGSDPRELVAKLNSKRGQSKVIDQESRSANEQVIEICRRYNVKPWFEIREDYGGGAGLLR